MTAQHEPSPGVGRLAGIHRYPVKSLAGELLDRAVLEARGLAGDRRWAVRDDDGKLGSGKSTRRFRRMDGLLELAAHYEDTVPVIDLGAGRRCRGDDPDVHAALSRHVGRRVTLAEEGEVSHFDEGPVHLVTSATLRRLERAHRGPVDGRRLRPNLVVDTPAGDGAVEDGWVGRRVAVGSTVVLLVRATMPRCVMVDLAQADLPAGDGLLRTIAATSGGDAGVVADVLRPGAVAVGDQVSLLD